MHDLLRINPDQVKPFDQDFHDVKESMLIFSQPIIFVLFASAACIQVHFRLYFIIKANNMNPDQIARMGAV